MTWTASQKLKAIEREIGYRRRVYPRWIEARKMTQQTADEQIAIFEAIADDYRKLAETERLL